jgi:hypothetical protein
VTNEQHNKYIAYSFFAHAGFQLLMLLLMFLFFTMFLYLPGGPGPPFAFVGLMMTFFSVFYLIFMLPSAIAGYALLKKKGWARTASIIAAVVDAMNVPIGTAAAIYALWFFFGENWKEVYGVEMNDTRSDRKQLAYGYESQRAAYEEEEREKQFHTYDPPDWR